MPFTVTSALQWWTRESPDTVAISFDDDAISYAQLDSWSSRIADYLACEGVKAGDRIAVVSPNSLEYAVLIIAMARIGAIGAPLSFRSAAREVAEYFEDIRPVILFSDAERHALANAVGNSLELSVRLLEDLRGLRSGETLPVEHEPRPEDPLFIIGTSGSTGRPKGVVYTHRMVVSYAAEFAITEPRCAHGSSVLSLGPFSSSSGYLLLNQFLTLGTSIYIESKFVPERALQLLVDKKINTMQAVPIFFERIALLDDFAGADLSHLHFTQTGGATVADWLLKAWHDKGVVLRQAYGNTESGGAWAARDDSALTEPDKCGRGGIFTEYAICDEKGQRALPGTPGEILVRSAAMTVGYWNNPKATAEAFEGDWFHTGDRGVMDANGNLKFIDRIKDIIISGGLNISATEVERIIYEIPPVEEVAVIGVKDEKFGETPLAIVYANGPVSVEEIIEHCNNSLSSYKVPRYVKIEVEPLPRLSSGKISKKDLRVKYASAGDTLPKVR